MGTIQNITEWQLFYLAQALTRAKRLEKHRADFHEELYEAIVYPTMRIDPLDVRGNNPATDTQAIRIIEAKERYERKICTEYARHNEWERLLTTMEDKSQLILIRYFQKKKHVPKNILYRTLDNIAGLIRSYEMKVSQERTEQSTVDYRKYQEQTRTFRKNTAPVSEQGQKVHVLVSGRFVYMAEEEYEAHKERESECSLSWVTDHEK